jgi:hypothetical protein
MLLMEQCIHLHFRVLFLMLLIIKLVEIIKKKESKILLSGWKKMSDLIALFIYCYALLDILLIFHQWGIDAFGKLVMIFEDRE